MWPGEKKQRLQATNSHSIIAEITPLPVKGSKSTFPQANLYANGQSLGESEREREGTGQNVKREDRFTLHVLMASDCSKPPVKMLLSKLDCSDHMDRPDRITAYHAGFKNNRVAWLAQQNALRLR